MKSRLLSILLTGFALSIGLLIAVQVTQGIRGEVNVAPTATVTDDLLNRTVEPVIFRTVSEKETALRLTGTSEPGAVISILNDGENFRQVKSDAEGHWTAELQLSGGDLMILDLAAFMDGNTQVKSDETVYRIPQAQNTQDTAQDAAQDNDAQDDKREHGPALLMVTAPGGPTRVIQSPFETLPKTGPLSMGPVDYDDRGSVIFSGTSEAAGTVRIYAAGRVIGENTVSVNGRWYLIAAERLPVGTYNIEAELITGDGQTYAVSFPFERLKPAEDESENEDDAQRLKVTRTDERWYVRRQLFGGGIQHMVIFAPPAVSDLSGEN